MPFPRLEQLLGAPVDSLDARVLQRAVDAGVPEGMDLDWKRTLYGRDDKGRHELAKDVAALANAVGGVIVLGVVERNGRAAQLTPVPLAEGEVLRMREVLASRLRPFLPGVEVRPVSADPSSPDRGFYVLAVPRSADAPHAVVMDKALAYFVRDEATTRWLSEGEVAARYRDRYAARAELAGRLEQVRAEGVARLRRWPGAWLCVAAVPSLAGARQPGKAALGRAQGFLTTWARRACPYTLPAPYVPRGLSVVAGVGRVIASSTGPYRGFSDDVHLELHHSGAGFLGCVLAREQAQQDGAPPPPNVALLRDNIELQVMTAVSMLAEHAVDTGAGGELLLRAELLLPTGRLPGLGPSPTELHAARYVPPSLYLPAEQIPGTLVVTNTNPTRGTALLEEVATGAAGAVRAAYPLAADLLAQFGLAEPAVLLAGGGLVVDELDQRYRQAVHGWAMQHGLVDD